MGFDPNRMVHVYFILPFPGFRQMKAFRRFLDFQLSVKKLHHQPFYFVRHGQTDWNLVRKLQGSTDIALNESGIAQAREARQKLAGIQFSMIFSSPMMRARKTADIIGEGLGCPIVEIDDLREWHFGSSEGSMYFDWLKEMFNGDITNVPDDVEPIEEFLGRTTNAINHALSHEGPVLIVAHGGTYIPANNGLARDEQWGLPNCQPVRHDPPENGEGFWRKTVL